MAITYAGTVGCNSSKSTATTLAMTSSRAVAIGELVIVRFASGAGADLSGATCTDSVGGNTYTRMTYKHHSDAGLNCRSVVFASKLATALTSTSTITVSWTGSDNRITMVADGFTGVEAVAEVAGSWGESPAAATSYSSGNSGTPPTATYLVIGTMNYNGPRGTGLTTQDSDTAGGAWSNVGTYTGTGTVTGGCGTTGAGAGSNETILGSYKIATSAAIQNYQATSSTSGVMLSGVLLFRETVAAVVSAPKIRGARQAVPRAAYF